MYYHEPCVYWLQCRYWTDKGICYGTEEAFGELFFNLFKPINNERNFFSCCLGAQPSHWSGTAGKHICGLHMLIKGSGWLVTVNGSMKISSVKWSQYSYRERTHYTSICPWLMQNMLELSWTILSYRMGKATLFPLDGWLRNVIQCNNDSWVEVDVSDCVSVTLLGYGPFLPLFLCAEGNGCCFVVCWGQLQLFCYCTSSLTRTSLSGRFQLCCLQPKACVQGLEGYPLALNKLQGQGRLYEW